jgi:hypothetical protein
MINLYLLCTPLLGGRIDREMADGKHVPVARVESCPSGLIVHLMPDGDTASLEYLEGLQARDCDELLAGVARPNVAVAIPMLP